MEFKKLPTIIGKQVLAELDVRIVCVDYWTYKNPTIVSWLPRNRMFTRHFTPTKSSWLDQGERLFAEVTRVILQRSVYRNVQTREIVLRHWVRDWSEIPKPYIWSKAAEGIPASLGRLRIGDTN